MRVGHIHFHACEICSATVPYRQTSDAKGLKMCPCRAAFYCGSEHQKLHWKIHRKTCYTRAHSGPLGPIDTAIHHIMQAHDASVVQFLPAALMKARPDCDLAQEIERMAAVITLEQSPDEEQMEVAVAAGRIPPYTISGNVQIVALAEEARRRGHPDPFFEHPADRQWRLKAGDLVVTLIFQPGGRIFTKRVLAGGPVVGLPVWEMIQRNSKLESFKKKGPWLDQLVYAANLRARRERDAERNLAPALEHGVEALVEFRREEFLKHGIGRVHLKPAKKSSPRAQEPDEAQVQPWGSETLPRAAVAPAPDLRAPNATSTWDSCVVT
ncbi:hypothetical protein B0H15DRAFT_649985 [Mycena belliarum]|uniref:MYND-type domain-containing protein n=1 Tax=Mycena belliarum TaxID=1033014 RepID=A0AAD6TRQ5_9AGAR|nr:hypothetical protein B0H15DRAFT_649985 [Mycena belliae]